MAARFICEYRYNRPWGDAKHCWTVVGGRGAIHFHVTDYGDRGGERGQRYGAGLEVHSRTAPEGREDDAPSHTECWLLNAPCWHDGTTLYAEETVLPFWLVAPNDHDRMFMRLKGEYRERFTPRCEQVA